MNAIIAPSESVGQCAYNTYQLGSKTIDCDKFKLINNFIRICDSFVHLQSLQQRLAKTNCDLENFFFLFENKFFIVAYRLVFVQMV